MANKRIKDLSTTATEADLVSGNYFALDGSAGTKKIAGNAIAKKSEGTTEIRNLSTTATENDLVSGNYLAIDGSAGAKKLPAEDVAKRSVQEEIGWEVYGNDDVITPSYKSGYVTNTGSFGYTAPDAGYTANSYNVSRYKKVILKTSVQHNAKYASFYEGDPSTNPSMGLITFRSDGELVLDVPEGAALLIVNSVFNGVGDVADVVLENDVEGLDNKVNELQDEVYGEYESITPSYKNGYVTNTGSFAPNAGVGYTANSYDVSQSEKVILKTSVQHNAKYASFYAGEPSSNPSMGLITFNAEDELDLSVPEGAALFIVNSVFNGVGIVSDVTLDNQVSEGINDKVKELQDELNGKYEVVTPSYKNGYVTNAGAFIYTAPDAGYTANSYDVSQSEKVVLKTSVQHSARYASFYAGNPSSNPSMGLITFNAEGELDLSVPEGAALLIVNSVFGGVGDVDDVVLENEVIFGIDKQVKKINARLTDVEDIVSLLDWSNKTWLMIGDSLTEKNFRADVSYYDYVKQVTNINLLNKGKSGDGYVHGDWFYTALGQVSANSFDLCTMFGSGNDLRYENTSLSVKSSWEEALGDVDDNGTMSICGYINRAISRFFELFPLKRIGIVTPTKWKNASLGAIQLTDEETMRRMTDYSRALVQIANKWGIPVMDLFLSSGLQPQIDAYRVEFYNENGVQDSGVHPNSKGHKLIYKQFLNFLNVNLIS